MVTAKHATDHAEGPDIRLLRAAPGLTYSCFHAHDGSVSGRACSP